MFFKKKRPVQEAPAAIVPAPSDPSIERFGVRPDFPVPGFVANYLAMLTEDDRAAYYHVARDAFTFSGTVFDLGTYAGGTTAALTLGILANRNFRTEICSLPVVHARDLFKADAAAPKGLNWVYPHRNFKMGDDFLDVFVERLKPVMHMIDVKQGDIRKEKYTLDRPIEILGLDLCKTRDITDYVVREFFPHLMVGAHVLHQDYLHAWLPHIHVSMGYFADKFRVVHECYEGGTVIFELTSPITPDDVDQFSRDCSDPANRHLWIEMFDRSIASLHSERSKMRCVPARVLLVGEVEGLKSSKTYFKSVKESLDDERLAEAKSVLAYVPKVVIRQ